MPTLADNVLSLHFGALCPKIRKQLRDQQLRAIDRKDCGRWQRDADAIVRLTLRGLITSSDARDARRRLIAKISSRVEPIPIPSDQSPGMTPLQRTRLVKMRALKAYGLRVRGLAYPEIARHLGRRDKGKRNARHFDKPISSSRVGELVHKGARIVAHWHHVRRRNMPAITMRHLAAI